MDATSSSYSSKSVESLHNWTMWRIAANNDLIGRCLNSNLLDPVTSNLTLKPSEKASKRQTTSSAKKTNNHSRVEDPESRTAHPALAYSLFGLPRPTTKCNIPGVVTSHYKTLCFQTHLPHSTSAVTNGQRNGKYYCLQAEQTHVDDKAAILTTHKESDVTNASCVINRLSNQNRCEYFTSRLLTRRTHHTILSNTCKVNELSSRNLPNNRHSSLITSDHTRKPTLQLSHNKRLMSNYSNLEVCECKTDHEYSSDSSDMEDDVFE